MSGKSVGESTEPLAAPKRSPTRGQATWEKSLPISVGGGETRQVTASGADEAAKQYMQRHYNSVCARASGVGGSGIFTEA